MFDYVWLIPSFPAIGFLINGFFGKRYSKAVVGWVGCSALGLSFFTSILVFFELIGRPPAERLFEKVIFDWVVSGNFQTVIGYQIDPLSILMALVVTGVSFFIHIYSVGYMHDDPGFPAVFYLPQPLRLHDAQPHPGQQLPPDVCGLGGRRPLFLSPDRILV